MDRIPENPKFKHVRFLRYQILMRLIYNAGCASVGEITEQLYTKVGMLRARSTIRRYRKELEAKGYITIIFGTNTRVPLWQITETGVQYVKKLETVFQC